MAVDLPTPPMPTVDAIWRAYEANARQEFDSWGISASQLGRECDRELWYSLRWTSPAEKHDGRHLRIFKRGIIEEERVLDDLRLAGLDVLDRNPDTDRQWTFSMANGWLRGKADGRVQGVIEAPKAEHVLEIKSLKAADFRAILKHGLLKAKPEHWHQLHAGMAGLGVARGLYVGVNKDTEEILTERLRFDGEVAARMEARVARIVDAHDASGRIADKPDAFACRFCRHTATCHGEALPRRNCRTCVHLTFTQNGLGHCERFNEPRDPKAQGQGATCPTHLYLPALVPGDQIDADPEAETITYHLRNGSEWTDGKEAA